MDLLGKCDVGKCLSFSSQAARAIDALPEPLRFETLTFLTEVVEDFYLATVGQEVAVAVGASGEGVTRAFRGQLIAGVAVIELGRGAVEIKRRDDGGIHVIRFLHALP